MIFTLVQQLDKGYTTLQLLELIMRSILLLLLGIPLPIVILIALFVH